jgi:hypothetical protein
MKPNEELRLITRIVDYLDKPPGVERKLTVIGGLMIVVGVAPATMMIIEVAKTPRVLSAGALVMMYFMGLATGLGCMFIVSGKQWPLLQRFLDRTGLEARRNELAQQISEKK